MTEAIEVNEVDEAIAGLTPDLCVDCPMRTYGPKSGYRVWEDNREGDTDTRFTLLDIAINSSQRGMLFPPHTDRVRVKMNTVLPLPSYMVAIALNNCKQPTTQERRILPDKKICGGLAMLLAGVDKKKISFQHTGR